jgi:peptidylprolyl isomerase
VLRPCELPGELLVQTIRPGSGREAADGDTVLVDYTGIRAETGQPFDSSYLRGVPFNVVLGRGDVIAGWDEGLQGVQTGELLKITIPADLAYGDNPIGDVIQPGDALTFVMEVRAVIPATTAEDAPLDLQVEPSIGATEVTWYDVAEGEGEPIELGDTAVVHMLLVRGDNEVVLFNSWERNDPLQIIMREGQTLPGVFEGIAGAPVGTTRVISMPPDAAFGPQGETGLGLPAGIDLIAVVEVVGVY